MKEPTRLEMTRFATLWTARCDFKRGKNMIEIYEPLQTTAPADARPSCSSWDITFYDSTGNREIERVRCHRLGEGGSPSVWMVDGEWWEVGGGEVRYVDGQWMVVRLGWKNTRAAIMANTGWPSWKSFERLGFWARALMLWRNFR